MSQTTTHPTLVGQLHSLRRFSVAEYHSMIDSSVLDDEDKVELLEGFVVLKMPHNLPHDSTIQRMQRRFFRTLPVGWDIRVQCAVTLTESEPEPDLAVVRGDDSAYRTRHPGPVDIGLIVEVADSSLERDRVDKSRIYADVGIPTYWIVNLVDGRIEVFTQPTGSGATACYSCQHHYLPGGTVPVILAGNKIADLFVDDLIVR